MKNKIKRITNKLTNKFSKIYWFPSIYYFLNKGGFQDEQYRVLSGIVKNRTNSWNLGNFRRAIHRIEKGLITEPAKSVFAESYILSTVLTFKKLINAGSEKETLIWASGILTQYFNTVEKTEVVKKAFEEFNKVKGFKNEILPETYFAGNRKTTNINIDDFLELNRQRRSVRYYQNKTVPRNLVESAINVALQAPSACNRQPFSYRIIDDPELLNIATKLPAGAITFSENIPMIIFVIGDLSNYFDERDKHLIYIDSALASMNFILSLEVLGLSSCIINWSDIPSKNKKLKSFLNLSDWEQCTMAISVGYALPECGIPSSIKKDIKSVIKYN